MDIEYITKNISSYFKIFLFFEETKINKILKKLNIKIPKLINDFKKTDEEIYNFINNDEYIILVGLGKKRDINIDKLNNIFDNVKTFIKNFDNKLEKTVLFRLENKDNNFLLDQILCVSNIYYKFDKYKTDKKTKKTKSKKPKTKKNKKNTKIYIYTEKTNIKENKNINKLIDSISFVKDLGNEPANILNPDSYVKIIKERGKKSNFNVKVIDEKKMREMGMNLFLSVAEGSKYPGYLVEINYNKINKKKEKKILIGKGITFDSGGLSLKSSKYMDDMKTDMIGSATVLGIIDYLSQIKSSENVIGLLAIAENMIGSNATRPGDIIESYNGINVEILNTDAEGRLVLGDTITYAQELEPKCIIDIATLTGQQEDLSCHLFANIMGNNIAFNKHLIDLGIKNNERLIELPLYKEFIDNTKSKISDIKNSNFRCNSSIIHGGAFLSNFIDDYKIKWAHIDIAGPGFIKEKTTGFGIRLLTDFITGKK